MRDAPRLAQVLVLVMAVAALAGPTIGAGHYGAVVVAFFWFFFAQPTGQMAVRTTLRMWPVPPTALVLAWTDTTAIMGLHPLAAGLVVFIPAALVGGYTTLPGRWLTRVLWPANPDLLGDFQRHTAQLMRAAHLEPFDLVVDVERRANSIDVRPSHPDTGLTLARLRAVCYPAQQWLAKALERASFSPQDPFLAHRTHGTSSVERFTILLPHVPENAHAALQRLAQTHKT
jgi:hypothetical protein